MDTPLPDKLVPGNVPGEFRVFVTPASPSGKSYASSKLATPAFPGSHVMLMNSGMSFQVLSNQESDELNDTDLYDSVTKLGKIGRYLRLTCVLGIWLLFTVILMIKGEKVNNMHQVSIPAAASTCYEIHGIPNRDVIEVTLEGSIMPHYFVNMSSHKMTVWIEQHFEVPEARIGEMFAPSFRKRLSANWSVPLVTENLIGAVPELVLSTIFRLENFNRFNTARLFVHLESNVNASLPVSIGYDISPIDETDGTLYAVLVLIGLYILIIFEIVHRTLAALLASTMSVAILATFNERPSMAELMSWIDVETLLLLYSMMVIVAILTETGVFDYLAVLAFKITGGKVWPLINTLCLLTALLSAFLDNVTVSLLMTPVTIRLCEVMELNVVPVLMAMVIYSNIGGTATAVGDPPNVIIASNEHVKAAGIDFTQYMMHMTVGVAIIMVTTYIQLRFIYRNISDLRIPEPHDITELKHEIEVWHRAAASVSSYSKDEDAVREALLSRAQRLESELRIKMKEVNSSDEHYKNTLDELQKKYPIRDPVLLMKSACTMAFVIVVFFLHSIPDLSLSLGWTALLGATLLLILADNEQMEGVLARVEWSTLLFFAALFVLMEALSKLGLIAWIGRQTEYIILSVADENSRLAVAVLLVLWVSAIASAFVDNIPLTTMMIKIVTSLSSNLLFKLPLPPLVWALSFGACLGGNGTLIGASSNVVCAGVAEQHGYSITFLEFFRVGFPVMLVSVITASGYLLISHVIIQWH
ncbi:P protein-like [Cloeon dipterum]|uniref:P protein-like n=1 Tax=Cloeon dipterum TaxID=197152 RepID=UPI00322039EF